MPGPNAAVTDSNWAQFWAGVAVFFVTVGGVVLAGLRHVIGTMIEPVKTDVAKIKDDQAEVKEALRKRDEQVDKRFDRMSRETHESIADIAKTVAATHSDVQYIKGKIDAGVKTSAHEV